MRKMLVVGSFVALALIFSDRAGASEGFDELAKLAKAGVGEEVMLAYINASAIPYDLSVDEILFFNDLGVSSKVTAAIVKHGKDLREAGMATQAQQPPPIAPVVAPPPQAVQGEDPVIGDASQDQPIDAPPIQKPMFEPAPDYQPAPIVSTTTVVAPQQGEANLSYFYEALSPYGQWIELDGQWVWQPSTVTVDTNWRPYCQRGHWVYTDAGMAWQSDYSWGWAPFHYGRWASHPRYGWVWTPDTVWGPAWVSWRNNETHCGWAPLPPAARFEAGVGFHFGGKHGSVDFNFGLRDRDYTFVPAERVTETTVTTYVVSRGEVATVYQQTTVIENPVVYRDNRVVNVGISLDFVKRKTHRDVRPVAIVDINLQAGQAVRGTVVTDASFAVYRPQIKNEAPVDPRVVAERREEAIKREQIRQQELTARTAIHQQNVTDQVAAREAARTQQVQANQAAAAAAAKARAEGNIAASQTRESEREQRLSAEQQRQADLQKAAEQKRQAVIAAQQANLQSAEQKRETEQAAAAQRLKAEQAAAAQRQKELEQKREATAAAAAQRQQTEAAAAAERQKELEQKREATAAATAERQKELEQKRETTAAAAAQRQQAEEAVVAERQKEVAQQRAAAQAAVAEREKAAEAKRAEAAAAAKERIKEAQAKRDADAAARAQPATQPPAPPSTPDTAKDPKKKPKAGGAPDQTPGN